MADILGPFGTDVQIVSKSIGYLEVKGWQVEEMQVIKMCVGRDRWPVSKSCWISGGVESFCTIT